MGYWNPASKPDPLLVKELKKDLVARRFCRSSRLYKENKRK